MEGRIRRVYLFVLFARERKERERELASLYVYHILAVCFIPFESQNLVGGGGRCVCVYGDIDTGDNALSSI